MLTAQSLIAAGRALAAETEADTKRDVFVSRQLICMLARRMIAAGNAMTDDRLDALQIFEVCAEAARTQYEHGDPDTVSSVERAIYAARDDFARRRNSAAPSVSGEVSSD